MNPDQKPEAIHLSDRCLVRVTGADAESFLQNIITNDMRRSAHGTLLYACLLMPQGFYLHDFFISREGDGFLLDCEAARIDDLLRRFAMFKLRSKVDFMRVDGSVYSAADGMDDPRLPSLGKRRYSFENDGAARGVGDYYDICIAAGIPCGGLAIKPGADTMADVNLDLLNAVAWDKGCFIGQEVAARMHYKSIAKRRLMVATGEGFKDGEKPLEGVEIRHAAQDGRTALVQVKMAALQGLAAQMHLTSPAYMPQEPKPT